MSKVNLQKPILSQCHSWVKCFLTMVLIVLTTSLFAQNSTIVKGIVKDADENKPLEGVSILIRGKTVGTSTDKNGAYSLTANSQDVLVFSMTGYKSVSEEIKGRSIINIGLSYDVKALTDVIVVGYGTQSRKEVTGAISQIKPSDVQSLPVSSIDQALQGRAAGVQVTQASGQPGGGVSIRVRGGNSINAGNEPLYVIDGVPVTNNPDDYSVGGGSSAPALNPLATINPQDIESIEILKDASATAIYGARAANGVVLITTKRGKDGRTQVTYDTYYGQQSVRRQIPLLNAQDYMTLRNEAKTNVNLPIDFTQQMRDSIGLGVNYQDIIFLKAPVMSHNLTVAGGNEKTKFALSGNYYEQKGIIIGSSYKRYSLRINLDHKISERFNIGTSITISKNAAEQSPSDGDGRQNNGQTSFVYSALVFNPTLALLNAAGRPQLLNTPDPAVQNPYWASQDLKNDNLTIRNFGTVYAEFEIVKGLKARTSLGWDLVNSKQNTYVGALADVLSNGSVYIGQVQNQTWLNENTLNYTKRFKNDHKLTVLGGATFQSNSIERTRIGAQNLSNSNLGYNAIGAANVFNQPFSLNTNWSIASFLSRINYNIKDRYLFTLTGRYDGSSRFGVNNKYAFFPSAAVAWRMIEEDFMKDINAFSDAKMRVSYGLTGNQEIPLYQSLALLSNTLTPFNGNLLTGFQTSRIANPDLKWESTAQFNVGFDLAFFKNRITLTTDYYYKKTKDLLLELAVPQSTGFSSAFKNVGSIENRGFELNIVSKNLVGANKLNWETRFNFAINRNKVLDLGPLTQILSGAGSGALQFANSMIILPGQPLGLFFGRKTDGIFQNQAEVDAANNYAKTVTGRTTAFFQAANTAPGDRRYSDVNGDGVISDLDRTIIGDANPDWIGGLGNRFSYKGFDLDIFVQGVFGNEILNLNRMQIENLDGRPNSTQRAFDNRWQPGKTNATYARANFNTPLNILSDFLVEDGTFIRVKQINFGYTFSPKMIKRLGIQRMRLYVSGSNLFTFTNYQGYDPEVSRFGQNSTQMGHDFGTFPQAKAYTIGASVNF